MEEEQDYRLDVDVYGCFSFRAAAFTLGLLDGGEKWMNTEDE